MKWLNIGLGLLAVGLAVGAFFAWTTLGGFPRDHDKYAEIPVPGQQLVTLPGENVRLDYQNDTDGAGDTESIIAKPEGLDVRVTPVEGGEPLAVDEVPSWIFSSITNHRGHEPWGSIDPPKASVYLIETADDSSPLAPQPNPAAPQTQRTGSGPAIAVGKKPWTPLGSVALGAIIASIVALIVTLAFMLPFRLFGGRTS